MPYVIERTGRGERQYDIYSRLLEDRSSSSEASFRHPAPTWSSPSCSFSRKSTRTRTSTSTSTLRVARSRLASQSMIQCSLSTPGRDYCIGQASSMGALLLAAGTKGKRFALPHSPIMIHPAVGWCARARLWTSGSRRKNPPPEKESEPDSVTAHGNETEDIERHTDRDYFMSATKPRRWAWSTRSWKASRNHLKEPRR